MLGVVKDEIGENDEVECSPTITSGWQRGKETLYLVPPDVSLYVDVRPVRRGNIMVYVVCQVIDEFLIGIISQDHLLRADLSGYDARETTSRTKFQNEPASNQVTV